MSSSSEKRYIKDKGPIKVFKRVVFSPICLKRECISVVYTIQELSHLKRVLEWFQSLKKKGFKRAIGS